MRPAQLSFAPLVLLLACGTDDAETPKTDSAVTESGPTDTGPTDTGPTDTGPTDTGPTDTDSTPIDTDSTPIDTDSTPVDTDTGPPPPNDAVVTFSVDGDWDNTALTLTEIVAADPLVVLDEVAWAEVTADTVTLTIPEPDPADLVPIEGTTISVVTYLAALHVDDGDARHNDGEPYVGTADMFVVYVAGTIPVEFAGLVEGWNVIQLDIASGAIEGIGDLSNIEIEVRLLPSDSISVGGTYASSADPDALGLAVLPYVSGIPTDLLYDAPLADPFSVTVSGTPPASHLRVIDTTYGTTVAIEYLGTYVDNDASGTLDFTIDSAATPVCTGNDLFALYWLSPPTTLDAYFATLEYGVPVGWFAGIFDATGNVNTIGSSAYTALTVSDNCQFPI